MRETPNPTRRAQLDHEHDEITVAVTFKWRRPWALDQCEAGVLVGDMRRLLVEHYGDAEWAQLAGLIAVETWDSYEERHVGSDRPADHVRTGGVVSGPRRIDDGTSLSLDERAARAQCALTHLGAAWRMDWSSFDGRSLRAQLDEIAGWLTPGAPCPTVEMWAAALGINLETSTWVSESW